MNQIVDVQVINFSKLQQLGLPLQLDNYQRPYVWGAQKIEQLLDDLHSFSQQKIGLDYYMGTILIHRNKEKQALFVIDGQQRLSSLSVLYHHLTKCLPNGIQFKYRSPQSVKNLQAAQRQMQITGNLGFDDSIFERLQFTLITVESEDLAFTFFDTQNNRGVALKATDLLKAYHLRAVTNGDVKTSEQLQQHCAKRWEDVQIRGEQGQTSRENDFAPELFHYYLWRARNWVGQKVIERETHDMVLDTFQKKSVEIESLEQVTLYPARSNQFANTLCLQENNEYRLDLKSVAVSSNAANLPFSIRQPIDKGVGFFLYAQKYAALLNELLHSNTADPEIKLFRTFYEKVVKRNSYYLRELFKLAVLMYLDQFGSIRLLEFSHRLEHVLGSIRLDKKYIFKEAPLKYLKESNQNLLDVISSGYRPEEIFDFLKTDCVLQASYKSSNFSKVEIDKGVQGIYLGALLKYYNQTEAPSSHVWLENVLKAKSWEVVDA